MLSKLAAFAATVLPSLATAQHVFAHVIVGNTAAAGYTNQTWEADIKLAASYGIDGFVLNIGTPYAGATATQMSYAFQGANAVIDSGELPNWRMLFSFDYTGGTDGAWPESDVISIIQDYGPNGAYFHVNGKPMVSTFEGPSNSDVNDWATIRSSQNGNLYFVPDWTSLGPDSNFNLSLVDGAFSWDMWPNGPADINTTSDIAWDNNFLKPAGKSYMMGVSPWFYTDLPNYHKAWVWRGDKSWSLRWNETLQILPDFVQIVTWNDYGESHYIGPVYESGIPTGAARYVDGYKHTAWLETLPYQIAAYKHAYNSGNAAPTVASGKDKIVYWYRTSPASQGTTDVTGNNCKSSINIYGYQSCYAVADILEDQVFAIVLAAQAGTASITIGSSTSTFAVVAGQNFISKSFGGNYGTVSVAMGSVKGSGTSIVQISSSTTANYNAWVGCAGSCSNP